MTAQQGPLHRREINRARQYYNPLLGLDVPRLRTLLEQGERGLNSQLQDLYRVAEKRYATLLALKTRRAAALKKLDWDIKITARLPRGVTAAQAEAQADYLRDLYNGIENLPQAVEALALASFRGYAHLEKHYQDYDPNLPIVKLQPVPQYHMLRSQETWDWVYDVTARNNFSAAVPIDPDNFVVREVDAPLNEIGTICFLRANLAEKDWTSFIEDYGIPSIFGILAPSTPIDKVKEWLEVIEKVTGNSRGALPPGSTVETVTPGNLEGAAFEKFLAHQDQVLVLAGTCGLLTMLTAAGSGTLAGSAHQEAFDMLSLAEGMEISALMQAQIDKPALARDFPSQRPAAYFTLAAVDEDDLDDLSGRLAKLYAAGLVADPTEISEKLGITLTAKEPTPVAVPAVPGQPGQGPVVTPAPAAPGGPADGSVPDSAMMNRASAVIDSGMDARFMAAAQRQLSAADRVALQPVIDRIQPIRSELTRLAGLTDDAAFTAGMEKLRPQLEQLRADLPQLEAKCLGDHPSAALDTAFSHIIGTAFVAGASDAAAAQLKVAPAKSSKS